MITAITYKFIRPKMHYAEVDEFVPMRMYMHVHSCMHAYVFSILFKINSMIMIGILYYVFLVMHIISLRN